MSEKYHDQNLTLTLFHLSPAAQSQKKIFERFFEKLGVTKAIDILTGVEIQSIPCKKEVAGNLCFTSTTLKMQN